MLFPTLRMHCCSYGKTGLDCLAWAHASLHHDNRWQWLWPGSVSCPHLVPLLTKISSERFLGFKIYLQDILLVFRLKFCIYFSFPCMLHVRNHICLCSARLTVLEDFKLPCPWAGSERGYVNPKHETSCFKTSLEVIVLSIVLTTDWTNGVRSPSDENVFSTSLCVQTSSEAHPASCPMSTAAPLPGVKRGRGVTLTTNPHLVPRSWMSRTYTYSHLVACMAVAGQLYCLLRFTYKLWIAVTTFLQ
jgi:hypothetical protein